MKPILIYTLLCVFTIHAFGQITNVKTGLWSDQTIWNNGVLPTNIDDVELKFDITIDVNASCQSLTLNGHNVTVNSGVNFNVIGNASATLLSMYIELDTTLLSPLDTFSKTLFYYDSAKRNIAIDWYGYDNGLLGDQQYKSLFFYNGNDTLPFKRIVSSPLLPITDDRYYSDTSFFFYTNGRLTRDSSVHLGYPNTPYITVGNFSYNNIGIIKNYTFYQYSPVSVRTESDTFYIQYLNGNIINQVDSSSDPYYFSSSDFEFVYDNHPNPFYHTQNKIALDYSYPTYYPNIFIDQIFEKNNAVEITRFSGTYNTHYKNVYEYGANGYPKIARYYDQNSPVNFGKALYFYTN